AASTFLTPRGHSRSINTRVPSAASAGSYARFSLTSAAVNLLPIGIAPRSWRRQDCRPPRLRPQSRKKPCTFFRCRDCPLEVDLRAKAFEIAVNDGNGQLFAAAPIRYRAVSRLEPPVDLDFVPALRVPDIGDAEIVLFRPEEWDGVEPFAPAKNVARGGLPLTFGHYEMFDADWLARQSARPAGDVAGSE